MFSKTGKPLRATVTVSFKDANQVSQAKKKKKGQGRPRMQSRPGSTADAVDYVIGHLSADDRESIAALEESRLSTLHHGLGT